MHWGQYVGLGHISICDIFYLVLATLGAFAVFPIFLNGDRILYPKIHIGIHDSTFTSSGITYYHFRLEILIYYLLSNVPLPQVAMTSINYGVLIR